MNRLAILALAAAGLLAAQIGPAQSPTDALLATRVDEYMTRLSALGYTGGVLVVRNGKTVFERSYGMANRAAGIAADTATVYNLGSITKQFTAAAILRLEEMGKLRTTDSVGRFLPNAPADKRGITLHQLLTHTAGFASDYSPTDYEPTTRDEYVRRMFVATLKSKPGTTFSYANSGYSLLAAIVEIVSGKDYEIALRDLVLRPAGMLETGYKAPAWNPKRIAHGYQDGRDWGTIVDRIAMDGAPYWALRGNGGLHTTLGDMAKWDAALNDARVFTDSSRRKFMTGYVNEGPEGRSQYAYGWAVMRTSRGTRLVTHNGGNGVFVAELLRFVDDRVTIFMTSTVSQNTASSAVRVVSAIVFGQPYDLPPLRSVASAGDASAAAGAYILADGSRLVIRVEDSRVLAEAVGQQAYQLLATGDTASSPNANALNAKSRAIVAALVKGDASLLVKSMGPGGADSTEIATQERELMDGRRERFGTFRSFDVLGTISGPEGGLQTTVRLNFDRGGATNIYTWDRESKIMDLGARPYAPVELLWAADGGLRSFDARSATGAHFLMSGAGLTAPTPHGTIVLTRQR
jgi:CubicO group peptidase (beta-lactamase class C family)